MVAEPTKVAKVDIAFDRVAKKLDVKALKESMWKRIQVGDLSFCVECHVKCVLKCM